MINDLDTTLEKIIYTEGKIPRTDVEIVFEQPNREWSARISRPTINLWAYDLRENLKLRPTGRNVAPLNDHMSQITRPPLRVDISYWVTAWARKVEDEHQLLWRALYALRKTPYIEPRSAEGNLRQQSLRIPMRIADFADTPINIGDLWGVLDNAMRLGFVLVVTLELDLDYLVETPLVLEKTLRFGQKDARSEQRFSAPDTEIVQKGEKKRSQNETE